jgi:hypothetical protein
METSYAFEEILSQSSKEKRREKSGRAGAQGDCASRARDQTRRQAKEARA